MIHCWSLDFRVGTFKSGKSLEWKGPRDSGRRLPDGRVFRRRMTLEKLDVAETSSWTLGAVDFSGKVYGSRDTCHHPN